MEVTKMSREINLSQGKRALVDDDDFEWLSQHKWTYKRRDRHTGYAYRNVYENSKFVKSVYMHRAILEAGPEEEVGHVSGDGLDNRRCNLRICTHAQNSQNRRRGRENGVSQYRGVRPRPNDRWAAEITTCGKQMYLGLFDSEVEAAIAYNCAARESHGDFATLNSVPDRLPVPGRARGRGTSRYAGVSWVPKYQHWRAEIRVNYKLIYLGRFDSEEEAAHAWNAAAKKHRGPKARLNRLP